METTKDIDVASVSAGSVEVAADANSITGRSSPVHDDRTNTLLKRVVSHWRNKRQQQRNKANTKIFETVMKWRLNRRLREPLVRPGFRKVFHDLETKYQHTVVLADILEEVKSDAELAERAGSGISDESKREEAVHAEQTRAASRIFSNRVTEAFNIFTDFIQKPQVIKMVDYFLNRLYELRSFRVAVSNDVIALRLRAREYLVAYVIVGFPEIVLGHTSEDLLEPTNELGAKQDMYIISRELVGTFTVLDHVVNQINDAQMAGLDLSTEDNKKRYFQALSIRQETIRKFCKQLAIYSNCFVMWKNQDLFNQVDPALHNWARFELSVRRIQESTTYSLAQKEESISKIKAQQDEIWSLLHKMIPTFDFDTFLPRYYELTQKMRENMELAAIDVVARGIEDKEFAHLRKILESIRDGVLALKGNDTSFVTTFNSNFDVEHIMHMVENEAYSGESFSGHVTYLLTTLRSLEAPARAHITTEEWSTLQTEMESETFPKVIAKTLKFISKIVHEIHQDVQRLQFVAAMQGFSE